DKAVLAQAISRGLGVDDGRLYLQKIVQIAFSLPRPESFVLRRELLEGAIELYSSVNGASPDTGLLSDLEQVADIYGSTLKTPREV
ncbi:P-loop NTPase fold protein, partial [Klebsiella pneumoniae]